MPQSPNRNGSLKRGSSIAAQSTSEQLFHSPLHAAKPASNPASPKIVAGSLRHPNVSMMSKGSMVPSPKGSPLRRPGVGAMNSTENAECPGSPMRKIAEEQWIDGPRVSRAKVAEARHLMREVNHIKQCETWIDGPKSQSSRSLTAGNLPNASSQIQGYGFMDSHKKSMIRQWVENQTSQVFQSSSAGSSPTHAHREQQAQHLRNITYHMSQLKQKSLDAPEDLYAVSSRQQQNQQGAQDLHSQRSSQLEMVLPLSAGLNNALNTTNISNAAEIQRSSLYRQNSMSKEETDLNSNHSHLGYGMHSLSEKPASAEGDEDQDSGPSEVPPALPLIEPLGSREISHESLHRILSRHVSRESLFQQQQEELRRQEQQLQHTRSLPRQSSLQHHYSQHSMGMSDCGLQVTEEEIARTMAG